MAQQNRAGGKNVRLFITCVTGEGKYLKFWAVPEGSRKILQNIELYLEEKSSSFEKSSSYLCSAQLTPGIHVCVKSEVRGRWCRARVEQELSTYTVSVRLIDYGTKETVLVSNVRAADDRLLIESPPVAVECILGDVLPMYNTEWSLDAVLLCEKHMCDQTMSGCIIKTVNKTPVVRLAKIGEGVPFVQRLVDQGFANIEHYDQPQTAKATAYSGVQYRSVPLDPKAPHMVKVPYVESTEKFFVQLSAAEVELNNLMEAIDKWVSREHLAPLESPSVNTPCLSPYFRGGGRRYYRALVVDVGPKICKILFVDYGYTEVRENGELKVIPQHFLTLPVQAIQCSLPGGLNVSKEALVSATSGKHLYCHILNFNASTYIVKLSFNNNDLFAPSDPGFSFYNIMHLDVHSRPEVLVSYVCSAFEFFCQLARNEPLIEMIQSKLSAESALNPVTLGDCIPGAPVCVKFSEDGEWYRAKVLQTESADSIKVTFVDYGNSESTSLNNIRRLAPELAKVPMQALRCTLFGTENMADPGSSGSGFFEELTENRKLMIEIVSSSRETGYVVNLYDSSDPNVTINSKLKQIILGTHNVQRMKLSVPEAQGNRPKPQQFAAEISIPAPIIDKVESFYVSSFTSPDMFFGQLSKYDESKLDLMQAEIHELYSAAGSSNFTPAVGDIVCARFSDDEGFYRARVEECVGGACRVFFIDYGNRETVNVSAIHKIRPAFTVLPPFGVECALQSWPPKISVEKLHDIMMDNVFQVNMLSEQNGKWTVSLTEDFVSNAPVLEFLRQSETPSNEYCNQGSKNSADPETDAWDSSDMNDRRQYRGDSYGRQDSSRSYSNNDRQNKEDSSRLYSNNDRQNKEDSSRSYSNNDRQNRQDSSRSYSNNDRQNRQDFPADRQRNYPRSFDDNANDSARDFSERTRGPTKNYGDNANSSSRNFVEQTGGPPRNLGDREAIVSSCSFGERTNFPKKNFADSTNNPPRNSENDYGWDDSASQNLSPKNVSNDSSSTPLQMPENSTLKLETSKLTDYSNVLITSNTYREVYVSHIVNPGEFYCQITEEKSKLPAMMEKIGQKYLRMNDDEERLDNVSVGLPCCAVYSVDGCWYRGKVIGLDFPARPSAYDIFFVDYGNVERVPKSKVKLLDPEFFSWPPQALKCALFNILPQGGSWNQEDIKTFMEMALDKCFVAKFEQVDSNGTHLVNLLNINKLQDDIINKDFTTAGHGRLADANKLLVINSQVASTNLTFADPDIRDGATEEVIVTWVVNPVEFYCQLQSLVSAFTEMMKEMQAYYGKTTDIDHAIDRPQPGMICVAQFSDDHAWYRAKVVSVEKNLVDVYYVDYGNSEQVSKKKVKYIHQDFTIHPVQGIRCRLEGVKLSGDSSISKSDGLKYFGGRTMCTFVRSEGGIFYVSLSNDSRDVAKELFQNKMVLPDSQSSALAAPPIVDVPSVKGTGSCCIPEMQLDMSPGMLLSVTVPFIESPRQFWCNLLDNADQLGDLMDLIDAHYNSSDGRPLVDINMERGCVAKYSEDERWYRAIVKNVSADGYEVFFVDYGNTDTAESCDVKVIEPEFCTLPAQAIECRLHGLPDSISSEAAMEFMKVLDSEELLAKIEYVDNGVLVVTLLDSSGEDEVNVGESIFGPIPEKQEVVTKVPGFSKSTIRIGVHNGYISCVNDPSDFYVQLEEIEAELADFAAELSEKYESVAETDLIVHGACVGMACCAKFTDDNQWYRAEVIDIADSSATVLFVDYGNTDVVQVHSLKMLTDDCLKKPPFAIHCKLAGVKPTTGETWSAEATTVFEQTALDTLVTVKFVSQELPAPVILIKDEEGDIAQQLADLQLCHYNKTESQNTTVLQSEVSDSQYLVTNAQNEIADLGHQKYAERMCDVKTTVKLSFVHSLDKIFVTPLDLVEQLDSVTDRLQELYDADVESDVAFTVDIAKPCVARYSEDMAWYRALVTDVNGDEVTVLFVDFGNSEVTGASSLKHLTPELLEIPPFAVECSLFGVTALPEKQNEITAKLEDFVTNEVDFEMEIIESSHPLKIKLKGERDLAEELVDEGLVESEHPLTADTEEERDFAEEFVSEGLAESDYPPIAGEKDGDLAEELVSGLAESDYSSITHKEDGDLAEELVREGLAESDYPPIAGEEDGDLAEGSVSEGLAESDYPPIAGEEDGDLAEGSVSEGLAESDYPPIAGEEDGDLAEELVIEGLAGSDYPPIAAEDDGDLAQELDSEVLAESEHPPPGIVDSSQSIDVGENDNAAVQICVQNVSIGKISASVKYIDISSNLIILHVVPSHLEHALTELQSRLEATYGQLEKHALCSSAKYCVAKSSEDNCWYRAQILESNEEGCYVKYIDYGNCETVDLNNVNEVLPEYSDEQQYSISCCMFGVSVVDGKEAAAESRLYELTEGKQVTLEISCDTPGAFGMCWGLSIVDDLNIMQTLAQEELVEFLYTPVQLPGEVFEAEIDSVEIAKDNLLFCLIPTSWNVERDTFFSELQEVYKEESVALSATDISTNLLYAVQFHDGWHRGHVLGSSVEQVVVYFIDFGCTRSVSPSCVRPLLSDFCMKSPLILRCALHDWEYPVSEAIRQKFYEVCMARTAECKAYDCSMALEPFSIALDIEGHDVLSCMMQFVNDSIKALEEEPSLPQTDATYLPDSNFVPTKENVEDFPEVSGEYFGHDNLDEQAPENFGENANNLEYPNSTDMFGEENFDEICAQIDFSVSGEDKRNLPGVVLPENVEKEGEEMLKYPERPISNKCIVKLSYVYSSDKFYVTPVELQEQLTYINTTLKERYELACESDEQPLCTAEVMQPCIAQYWEDMTWYRALITGVEDNEVSVLFIDFGNTEVVERGSLRTVIPELLKIPPVAIECSLFGIQVVSEKLEAINSRLTSLLESEVELEMEVIEHHEPYKVKLKGDVDISEQLITDGLCDHYVPPSQKLQDSETFKENLRIAFLEEPLSLEDNKGLIPYQNISVGEMIASVKHIELSNDVILFHIVPGNLEDPLAHLQERLQAVYGNSSCSGLQTESKFCAAKSSEDGQWYRAQVLEKCDECYSVKFSDYGNCEIVRCCDVRELLPEFLVDNQYSVACCLSGVKVVPGKEEAVEAKMHDLTSETETVVEIFEVGTSATGMCRATLKIGIKDITYVLFQNGLVFQVCIRPCPPSALFEAQVEEVRPDDHLMFCVIPKEWIRARDVFQEELQEVCSFPETFTPSAISLNCLYATRFDKLWYRATVLSMNEDSLVANFIDFGYRKTIGKDSLQILESKFCHKPPFVLQCLLCDVTFPITDAVCDKFAEICSGKMVTCKVQQPFQDSDTLAVSIKVDDADVLPYLVQLKNEADFASKTESRIASDEMLETLNQFSDGGDDSSAIYEYNPQSCDSKVQQELGNCENDSPVQSGNLEIDDFDSTQEEDGALQFHSDVMNDFDERQDKSDVCYETSNVDDLGNVGMEDAELCKTSNVDHFADVEIQGDVQCNNTEDQVCTSVEKNDFTESLQAVVEISDSGGSPHTNESENNCSIDSLLTAHTSVHEELETSLCDSSILVISPTNDDIEKCLADVSITEEKILSEGSLSYSSSCTESMSPGLGLADNTLNIPKLVNSDISDTSSSEKFELGEDGFAWNDSSIDRLAQALPVLQTADLSEGGGKDLICGPLQTGSFSCLEDSSQNGTAKSDSSSLQFTDAEDSEAMHVNKCSVKPEGMQGFSESQLITDSSLCVDRCVSKEQKISATEPAVILNSCESDAESLVLPPHSSEPSHHAVENVPDVSNCENVDRICTEVETVMTLGTTSDSVSKESE